MNTNHLIRYVSEVELINDERENGEQILGWLFRPLALCPFPTRSLGKREVRSLNSELIFLEEEVLWVRRSALYKMEMISHPDYGVPYGQDVLIVLFFSYMATLQKNRQVFTDFYKDFFELFEIKKPGGKEYRELQNGLMRISHTLISFGPANLPKDKKDFIKFFDQINFSFSPSDSSCIPTGKDQFAILSHDFWDNLVNHRIPFNLRIIRLLKTRINSLNLYLFLSTRCGQLYAQKCREGKSSIGTKIPFWGEAGLQNQFSSAAKSRKKFRQTIQTAISDLIEVWPNCPITIDGNSIVISIQDYSQLDIQPDFNIELGKAIRELPTSMVTGVCPLCNTSSDFVLNKGEYSSIDKMFLESQSTCPNCNRKLFKSEIIVSFSQ
jgi:hypothetical protein